MTLCPICHEPMLGRAKLYCHVCAFEGRYYQPDAEQLVAHRLDAPQGPTGGIYAPSDEEEKAYRRREEAAQIASGLELFNDSD